MLTRITEYSEFEKFTQKFGRSTSESTEDFLNEGGNTFYFKNRIGEVLGDVGSSCDKLDCDFVSIY